MRPSQGIPWFYSYELAIVIRAKESRGFYALLFWRLQRAWPEVRLILRADAGFSLPEVIQVCERSKVSYAFGLSLNAVLNRKIADLLERARLKYIQTQQKARLFDDVYYAAGTWDAPRRLGMKAEWLLKNKPILRFSRFYSHCIAAASEIPGISEYLPAIF
jgi:hypothetical protein